MDQRAPSTVSPTMRYLSPSSTLSITSTGNEALPGWLGLTQRAYWPTGVAARF